MKKHKFLSLSVYWLANYNNQVNMRLKEKEIQLYHYYWEVIFMSQLYFCFFFHFCDFFLNEFHFSIAAKHIESYILPVSLLYKVKRVLNIYIYKEKGWYKCWHWLMRSPRSSFSCSFPAGSPFWRHLNGGPESLSGDAHLIIGRDEREGRACLT